MKVAIVGSGVAGLAAAFRLGSSHEVHLFEASARIGGHVHTVRVPAKGGDVPVDMGFIVYNEARYPNLARLFAELGVRSRGTDMSFSVHRADTGFEYGTAGARALFARRRDVASPRHWRLLMEIARFAGLGRRSTGDPRTEEETLGGFLERNRVPRDVIEHFVVPLGAAIWSTATAQMMDFPAATYLRFCEAHGMLDLVGAPQWRTLVGGSESYVTALLPRLGAQVHRETPVHKVHREGSHVVLELSGSGAQRRFDRCILATHSDQSLALLADPTPREARILGAIRYTPNLAVLHTDASYLPERPAARSSWNFRIEPDGASATRATVTYWMNRLQGIAGDTTYCVSLNPTRPVSPSREITRCEFAHPRFDLAAIRAQRELPALQGTRGTYYCGAWQRYGFHEDGFWSGLTAARALLRDASELTLEGDSA